MKTKPRSLGLIGRLGVFWCGLMHTAPMWPIHGSYQCRKCGRSYLVPWAGVSRVDLRPEIGAAEVRV